MSNEPTIQDVHHKVRSRGKTSDDLISLIRKEDNRLGELVSILKQRKVITDDDVRRILGMEPFPQISI